MNDVIKFVITWNIPFTSRPAAWAASYHKINVVGDYAIWVFNHLHLEGWVSLKRSTSTQRMVASRITELQHADAIRRMK